ncbi:probable low-specificity L-threonine aldolase 2 [Penaeus japonicus]|uniref:probable low-specificity L-threonine aldolase 2 n=1 Tax=Penaeus japonicus TaxID=27405 RepID=UPI001C712A6E|nr:probable low-specificity L-threonine aldolase 2 [Penaeus japonicus]
MAAATKDDGARVVDLRSDTLTQPSAPMKEAMVAAPLGDDVFGEDPTVMALQEKVARLLAKEAALFVPTGTMGNLICVLNHCRIRGSEVLLGNLSHIHVWEQGGISQLGGVHPRTLKNLPDGTFSLEELRQLVRGDNPHWPVTSLVCVENTHNMVGGRVLPLSWMDELGATCRELGLPLHMDGARLLNAATALGVPAARLVRDCDSVSVCLSKGLGAPVGSVVAGTKDFIRGALRLRKALGGGMRQAGLLAAAGIYALDHGLPKLAQDHAHVRTIAQAVSDLGSKVIKVDLEGVQTNILLLECDLKYVGPEQVCKRLSEVTEEERAATGKEVIVRILPMTASSVRLVVHCNISPEDIPIVVEKLIYVIREFERE